MIDDWKVGKLMGKYWTYSVTKLGTELNKEGEEVKYGNTLFDTVEDAEQAIELWREKQMKNYMKVNGKTIEISQETADNLEKQFSPKTYKLGQKVTDGFYSGILISTDYAKKKVAVYSPDNFWIWNTHQSNAHITVNGLNNITLDEIKSLCGNWRPVE